MLTRKTRIGTSFHSWAEETSEYALDLNEFLIQHKSATFFIRVDGDGMIDAGIHSEDILIVDRALSISHDRLIVARLDGELVVKRIHINGQQLYLVSNTHEPIFIAPDRDFEIWGVVTYVIHRT